MPTLRVHRVIRAVAAAVLGGLLFANAHAQQASTPPASQTPSLPQGKPHPGPPLRDRDFGVSTSEFGLDRQVEMYQWRAIGDGDEGGYRRVWNAARIDSSGFAPGYENPSLPIAGERWWSQDATLDGHPIDTMVLQAIGEWRPFRPNFARLPVNIAAAFQPEGDGLGSAENPLEPQIGDLRITWRELHLPPLPGRVELRDGAWQLSEQTAAAALNAAPLPPAVEVSDEGGGWLRYWPWGLGGVLLLVVVGLGRSRKR